MYEGLNSIAGARVTHGQYSDRDEAQKRIFPKLRRRANIKKEQNAAGLGAEE
jgi:hypothetical protein